MRSLWRERNSRCFENDERCIPELKLLFLEPYWIGWLLCETNHSLLFLISLILVIFVLEFFYHFYTPWVLGCSFFDINKTYYLKKINIKWFYPKKHKLLDRSKLIKNTKDAKILMSLMTHAQTVLCQKQLNKLSGNKYICELLTGTTWKTTRCSKLQKSTIRYRWEPPFLELSRSLILSLALIVRRSSQSTRWICPLSYLFSSFSKRSNSPRSCRGTYTITNHTIEKKI